MKRLAAFFVKGRLDHMDVDVKGKRLFVAGLENGTLEVVDLQGAPRLQRLFVAAAEWPIRRFVGSVQLSERKNGFPVPKRHQMKHLDL